MSLRRPIFPDALWRAAGVAAFCGLACLSAAPASAGYVMSGPQSKELLPLLSQRPMDVYVATGAPDSCGPGCSKWIAVEGKIDPGSGKRFREFLAAEPERRNLPVFFHSPGGASDGIVIALSLRENNMTAGVGRPCRKAAPFCVSMTVFAIRGSSRAKTCHLS